jgi:hypothetical protein
MPMGVQILGRRTNGILVPPMRTESAPVARVCLSHFEQRFLAPLVCSRYEKIRDLVIWLSTVWTMALFGNDFIRQFELFLNISWRQHW